MAVEKRILNIGGVRTCVRQVGSGARTILLLHGGVPGVTPYCGGGHLFGDLMDRLSTAARVIAPELLGSGETGYLASGEPLSVDSVGEHLLAVLAEIDAPSCHVIGHDFGGLAGVWLAMRAPERVRSMSIVASAIAAPSIDSVDDITFLDPPGVPWSRASQAWALKRVSFTSHHIDADLLDACAAAAEGAGHLAAQAAMASPQARASFDANVFRTKWRLWTMARTARAPAPMQVIWAANDPLTAYENGLLLFQTIGRNRTETQFHYVNRSGSFIFREQPEQFVRLVSAFHEGLEATVLAGAGE